MVEFVDEFLDLSEAVRKDVNLVKALIDLIQQDQSIAGEEEFYIEPNGGKKKKAALGDLNDVCLPSFLLGVWHYVVINRKDNSVGKDTYDASEATMTEDKMLLMMNGLKEYFPVMRKNLKISQSDLV